MKDRWDIFAFAIIFIVITVSSIPPLASGNKLNFNDDFFQYASRYEAIRKSLFEYHTFPFRSHWFGGGYPTLGDPEDPTLNPLMILTVFLGTVKGLKAIAYILLLTGGLSAYALARYVLGYTRWGSLYAGLIFGASIFIPSRIADGNYNEGYAAFIPLCMLLIGLACRRKKVALFILPFVFYIMLSDGKLNALMAIFYMGIFCLLDVVPVFSTFTDDAKKVDIRPVKILILVLVMTFLIGMVRFLPAFELISARGGLKNMDLAFRPKTYEPGGVFAYTFQQLWQEAVGRSEHHNLVTTGWVPVALFAISLIFWRKTLPWGINLLLFVWLILAYNAPVDLLKFLWNLPIFSTIYRPYKYFSFQIGLTIAIASGQPFWLLRKLPYRWLEDICAVILIIAALWFLYPRMAKAQRDTYDFDLPAEFLVQEKEFYNIQGKDLDRNRKESPRSVTYYNLLRNIGTIDWYTGIPVDENAIPRYFVDIENNYIPNPEYRGEVFFLEADNIAEVEFQPNSIIVRVHIETPDILVVNQNYHRDWHTDRGELYDRDGLLAIRLHEAGSYTILMRYTPRSFYTGLAVSVLSLAVLAFICWAYGTGRLLNWSHRASPIPRFISKAILWLMD
jgi:hypothetical protein